MFVRRYRTLTLAVALVTALATVPAAETTVTSPKQFFGFSIGDDYQLANYTQLAEYWHKLERESNRMKVVEIGKTSEGRPQLMAIISSPENLKKLDAYKTIAARLAHAEGLTDDQARQLARDGKAVVWIDGGLHATEVLGAHQLIEMVYQMVSRTDAETERFLNDVILLCVHANPDGMELVSNWYMREKDPMKRSLAGVPRLYNKYAGHDDNRDLYMSNLAESTNMNRVMYREWYPQIMYNHHQTGPEGTVMFAPPFRDPFNFNFDPQVPIEIDLIGAAINSRMVTENKPGVTSRKGQLYSTWWNGGLRTTAYFHNMIGLLTETIGSPTPMTIPFIASKQLPDSNLYYPIEPQVWHFRQSIDYSITANRAVLDVASREKENFLFNIYRMGKNSIERGNRDSWTTTPREVLAAEAAVAGEAGGGRGGRGGRGNASAADEEYERAGTRDQFVKLLRDPAHRDPRGFILSSDQPDFPTAVKFINTLVKNGITIERATAAFSVGGKNYPAGSYIVKTAQAFRPHVMDMFEPQDHPDDVPYPGGAPTPPYDNAGWTLAFQMGVTFDRILDDVNGPFQRVTDLQKPAPGKVTSGTAGYLLTHASNDAFTAVNRLLAAGEEVSSVIAAGPGCLLHRQPPVNARRGGQVGRGSWSQLRGRRRRAERSDPEAEEAADRPGGSVRWVHAVWLDALPAGAVRVPVRGRLSKDARRGKPLEQVRRADLPERPRADGEGRGAASGIPAGDVPAEFRDQLGSITAAATVPQLKKFLEDGGTIVAVGRSAGLGRLLGLPIENHLVERTASGVARPLPREKYYVPGSILKVAVDRGNPVTDGLADHVDVFFDNNPVYTLEPDASLKGVRPVAWFDSTTPLRSGWAYGQGYLAGGVVGIDAPVGKGRLFLFTPEITFRGQPHGTFKFLFNGIYLSGTAR